MSVKSVKSARLFGILALITALFQFASAVTGGPVVRDVVSGGFAAAAGCVVLVLVSELRDR